MMAVRVLSGSEPHGALSSNLSWRASVGSVTRRRLPDGYLRRVILPGLAKQLKFELNAPWGKLPDRVKFELLFGTSKKKGAEDDESRWEGILSNVQRRYTETTSDAVRAELEEYMIVGECPDCRGRRLKPESLAVTLHGKNIGEFTATGVELNVMSVGTLGISAVTGLGFDTAAGRLWVSDGAMIYAMSPSAPGSCLPPVINSSFVPAGLGFVTDVSWHSPTGRLFACDVAGMIAGYTAAGVLVAGPWAQAASGCPLGLPLVGIAADTSSACPGGGTRLWVTDGTTVDYQFVGGLPAPAKFYSPFNCYPWSSAPTQGLEYVARPISYGTGTGPVMSAVGGQSVLPNPNFKLSLTGGPPGGVVYLLYGTGASCPPLNFFGNPWFVNPFTGTAGPFPVSATGTFVLPAGLPNPGGSVPCGASIFVQWLCKSTGGIWTTSQGVEFTTSIP
jgi:hypothetical protein